MKADHVTERERMELIGATLSKLGAGSETERGEDEMNQNAEQKSAVYPREEDTAMLSQEETLKAEIAAKD